MPDTNEKRKHKYLLNKDPFVDEKIYLVCYKLYKTNTGKIKIYFESIYS